MGGPYRRRVLFLRMAIVSGHETPSADQSRPAIEDVTQIAAPVLAGFSITLVALLVTAGADVRLAGAALLTASVSAVSQLVAIQCGAWARHYHTLRSATARDVADANKFAYDGHVKRARWLYGIGVIALLCAMSLAIVPKADTRDAEWRWAAVVFIAGVAVLQIGWGWLVVWGRQRPYGRFGNLAQRYIYDDRD